MAERGPDALLAALDPEQREVALADSGPVCVLAGAGTGKTRAIAYRIAYAAATGATDPARLLAVTFTTRAAGELRARLRQLSGVVPDAGLDRVRASTFHSAALRQLTHFWPRAVGGPPPRILDAKAGLLSEVSRRLGTRASPAELRDIAGEIEWAKVSQVRPEEYADAAVKAGREGPVDHQALARIYAAYEQARRARNLVDFESVLELSAAILADSRAAAGAVRDRYRTFVIDEYQDVNPLQKLLVDQWLGPDRDDICVVGDPRQTIYTFTGATAAYLTRFAAEFPRATVIRLVRNYRSTPQVIDMANRLASPDGPKLVAQRPSGATPRLTEYKNEPAEAAAVAKQISRLIQSGTPASAIAILVRTNAQTQGYEHALAEEAVPYGVRGSERFFERSEVRRAVVLLRAASRAADPGEQPHDQVRSVLSGLGHARQPPAGRGSARDLWESLEALAQLADDFFAANPGATLRDLAEELEVRASTGHAPAVDGVTLSSLHSAKGLEWDAVFIAGLTDGTLPIIYADTEEAIEEERRLLYVGITRARQRLSLSWALARSPGGRPRSPSRFLAALRTSSTVRPDRSRSGRSAPQTPGAAAPPSPHDPVLARLREWRRSTARAAAVPAYVVFSDATLAQIAVRRPVSLAALAGVPGVGPVKLGRYGAAVLAVCMDTVSVPDGPDPGSGGGDRS